MSQNWLHKIAQVNPPMPPADNISPANVPSQPDDRTIFTIPDAKLDWLNKKIDGLNKVAKKLGLPPVGYKVLEQNIAQTQADSDADDGMTSLSRTATKIEIFGEAPVLQGWKFIARILHDDVGNVLKSVPGEELPPQYRTALPKCDHCGYNRKRKDTFVLKNVESGEFKQVGSTCLADFLGHGSPGLYASFAENMADLADELEAIGDEWEGGGGGGYEKSIDINYYLKVVFGIMKKWGWLGRGAARDQMKQATADIALNLIYGAKKDTDTRKELNAILESITADDESMLHDALIWVRSLKDGSDEQTNQLSDYYWNLAVACSQERVKARTEGIVASLPVAYDKAVLKLIKPDAKSTAGEKGQTVVVKGKIVEEKMFGDSVVYDILSDDNKMVRCTFPAETQLEGKEVVVEGTVLGYSRKFTFVVTLLGRVQFLNADQYPARQQELQQEQQNKQQGPKPNYQVGQKVTTNLAILKMREMDTQFGHTTLVSMVDDFGMSVNWWASNTQDLKEGEKVNITATVKSVGDYKGNPQITITRPKINSRAMDKGVQDPRLPAAEVRNIKKQMKALELEYNQLCYGYSLAEHPEQDKYNNRYLTISVGENSRGDPTGIDKQKAVDSIFPPVFYSAARQGAYNNRALDVDNIFMTDRLETVVDALIQSCAENIKESREHSWEESGYQQRNNYDIEYVEREQKAYDNLVARWPQVLQKVQELTGGTYWSVERLLQENLPYEVRRKFDEKDRFFWSHQLQNMPKEQWVTFIDQTVQPVMAEYKNTLDQKMQAAWAKMREGHGNVRARIQQEEVELQEVVQNRDKYVAQLQQLVASTPFKSFLMAKPRREELSKAYSELEQRLLDSAAAVKQYGPLETKKKQAGWLIKTLEKLG